MLLFSQKTAKIDDCTFQMHVMSILNILNLCELLLIQPLRDWKHQIMSCSREKTVSHFTLKHAVHIYT